MPKKVTPRDDFHDFSNLLSEIVEAVQKNKKKEELEKIFFKMDYLAEKIGGEVLQEFIKLKQLVGNLDKNSKEIFLNQCLRLKNELWEL